MNFNCRLFSVYIDNFRYYNDMYVIMRLNPDNYNWFISTLIITARFFVQVYQKFRRDAGLARAGSLAYNTLLAAVPFGALVVSLMSAFGALDSVQNRITDAIVQFLVPTRQADFKAMFDQFLGNSNKLGVIGLVVFAITSIMLLNTINANLNEIWGSRVKTNFMAKFTTYASVIIFGTLLLAASTTFTSRFNLFQLGNVPILNRLLLNAAPFLADFLVLVLIIGLSPSGKVEFKYVFITSAVGAVLWELLKYGVFTVSSWAIRMSVIYGTIAIVPIFLFWIYIIWLIIILAMESAWVLQHKGNAWMGKPVTDMNPYEVLHFGLELFLRIAADFDAGKKPPSMTQLASDLSVSVQDIAYITGILRSENLLLGAGNDGNDYVPARSIDNIHISEVITAVFGNYNSAAFKTDPAVANIADFYQSGITAVSDKTIAEIIRSSEQADTRP